MPYRRKCLALFVVALAAGAVCISPATTADADLPSWNGKYALVRYAADKTGTSMAARPPEPDFSDEYVFVTSCSASTCVATVTEGPRPKNPTLPLPPQNTWKGNQWVHIYDWQWDCFVGEGVPKEWSPARSSAFYVPQSDGSLRGNLADRHIQRRLPGHSDHAGGGLSRPARSASHRPATSMTRLMVFGEVIAGL
jgi:hypothetical protein